MSCTRKSKPSPSNRLPSLYVPTLMKSDANYQREMRQKLIQIERENLNIVRRRLTTDHLFTHEHLKKRYQWFQGDRSFRDACRVSWKKQAQDKPEFLPIIYPTERSSLSRTSNLQINENDDANTANEKLKQKFLRTQPLMVEILNAPHAFEAFKYKANVASRKKSAQRRHVQIQRNAIDDQRYLRLVGSLEGT